MIREADRLSGEKEINKRKWLTIKRDRQGKDKWEYILWFRFKCKFTEYNVCTFQHVLQSHVLYPVSYVPSFHWVAADWSLCANDFIPKQNLDFIYFCNFSACSNYFFLPELHFIIMTKCLFNIDVHVNYYFSGIMF